MDGENDFAGSLVYRFAAHHRANYGACKTGLMDVLTGAVSYLAQIQGAAKGSHIRDKVTEMIHLSETLYSSSIACSAEGVPTPSGAYMVDTMLANVCKQNVTRFHFEVARLATDIAGGFIATMPSEYDLRERRSRASGAQILQRRGRYSGERPYQNRTFDRGHDRRHRHGRIHARRRISPGPAHYDFPRGKAGRKSKACQGSGWNSGKKTDAKKIVLYFYFAIFIFLQPPDYNSLI